MFERLKTISASMSLALIFAGCATSAGSVQHAEDAELHPPPPASEKAIHSAAASPPDKPYARPTIVIRPVQEEPATERVVDPYRAVTVAGMSKRRISIDMREVDIANALRLFASEGGVNIIADEEVKGTVTLTVRDAPVDQVFLTMLQSLDLGYEQRGDIIRVAPREKLLGE